VLSASPCAESDSTCGYSKGVCHESFVFRHTTDESTSPHFWDCTDYCVNQCGTAILAVLLHGLEARATKVRTVRCVRDLSFIHNCITFWAEGEPGGGEVGHAAESDPQRLRSRRRLGGTVVVVAKLREQLHKL
jgi:hypothetical protein